MGDVFAERNQFGRFYYRFANGEAGTDVYDRMATFITYLFRHMGSSGYFDQRTPADGEPTEGASAGGADGSAPPPGERRGLVGRVLGGRARRPPPPVRNYVLVTHGLLMRIFCMCAPPSPSSGPPSSRRLTALAALLPPPHRPCRPPPAASPHPRPDRLPHLVAPFGRCYFRWTVVEFDEVCAPVLLSFLPARGRR